MTATLSESVRHTFNKLAQRENVHVGTIRRWVQDGVRGIKLLAIRRGGRRFILESDWQKFCAELNADQTNDTAGGSETARPGTRRQKESAAARIELEKLGV